MAGSGAGTSGRSVSSGRPAALPTQAHVGRAALRPHAARRLPAPQDLPDHRHLDGRPRHGGPLHLRVQAHGGPAVGKYLLNYTCL